MQVACTSCPAKYAVPDEKVRGKRARITCKHCGAAIIIDGTGLDRPETEARAGTRASQAETQRDPTKNAPNSSAPRSQEGPWVVALAEGRQESVSIPRLVELYASGVVGENTYVWREGMSDWKKPFEIPQIEAALGARGFLPNCPPAPAEDEATQVVPTTPEDAESARNIRGYEEDSVTLTLDPSRTRQALLGPPSSGGAASRPRAVTKLGIGGPEQVPPTLRASTPPPPARNGKQPSARPLPELHHQGLSASPGAQAARAARRPYARGANGGVDLFAERPSSHAPPPDPPEASAPWTEPTLAPRMTGARNESSVLFSLDALKAERETERRRPAANTNELLLFGAPPPPPPPFQSQPPPGSPFGAALSAPDFTAPAPPRQPRPVSSVPPRALQTLPPQRAPAYPPQRTSQAPAPRGVPSQIPSRTVPTVPPSAPVSQVPQPRRDFNYAAVASDDIDFRPRRGRARYFLIALLVVGAVAGGVFALGLADEEPKVSVTAPPPAPPPPPPVATTPPPEPAPTPAASAEPAPTSPPVAAAPTWRSPRSSAPRYRPPTSSESADGPVRDEPEETASARKTEPSATEASSPATPRKPLSLADAIAASEGSSPAGTTASTSTGDSTEGSSEAAPFDKSAALTALTSAADNAQSCKKLGGPTGDGQATVTFAPSGRVTMANVGGDFAGSSVGSCIAKLFRTARVPAFSGGPVTVTKRFSIE